MKVLFVPDWSRGNPYQKILMQALQAEGIDVTIGNFEAGLFALYKTSNKYADCDIIHMHWINDYIAWIFWAQSNAKKFIKSLLFALDIILVRLNGKKVVWTIHNTFTHNSMDRRWEKRIRRILIMLSNRVLVHSGLVISELQSSYGIRHIKNYSVVPHSHFIGEYPDAISREDARALLGIPSERKVFLCFGSLKPYKGVEHIVSEFRRNSALSNATLVIAGRPCNPEYQHALSCLISDATNIRAFFEFIPNEKVQVFMKAADIALFSFTHILTSGSVILAMSFGKALIAPLQGCLAELLDEEGALFYYDDASLRRALEQALLVDAVSFGAHNKNRIRQYSPERVASTLKQVYCAC